MVTSPRMRPTSLVCRSNCAADSENTHEAGTTVANLSPALAEELNLSSQSKGVIITEIAPTSVALRFGIHPGDMVVRIDKEDVSNVDALVAIMARPAKGWHIELKRDGKQLALDVKA